MGYCDQPAPSRDRGAGRGASTGSGSVGDAMQKAVIATLRLYKRFVSPLLPSACRFSPTCSEYMLEAVDRYGVLRGVGMGLRRSAALPSIPCGRLRSGSLEILKRISWPITNSNPTSPREERTLHGAAAPAGVCADGIGAVPDAVFLQSAAPAAQEDRTSTTSQIRRTATKTPPAASRAAGAQQATRPNLCRDRSRLRPSSNSSSTPTSIAMTLSNRGRNGPQLDPEEIPRQARQAIGIDQLRQLFQSGAPFFLVAAGR